MTNEELIAKIKEEIERQLKEGEGKINLGKSNPYWDPAVMSTLSNFQSFLSDLEKSLPAKVADGEGLEEEIERYLPKIPENPYNEELRVFARYFYDLGCRRTAEKYDEIEYNRQRASGSSEIPNDLETAAIQAAQSDMQDRQIMEASNDERMRYSRIFRRGFNAGAKWQKEQMLKETVEADVMLTLHDKTGDISLHTGYLPKELGIKCDDKVRIIIIKDK